MEYKFVDYLFGIIITIIVYDLIPIIVALKFRNLKLWVIRTISIVNYILGYGFFYTIHYLIGGTNSTGGALLWSFIGYTLMKKYSLKKDTFSDNNNVSYDNIIQLNNYSSSPDFTPCKKKKKIKPLVLHGIFVFLTIYSICITVLMIMSNIKLNNTVSKYNSLESNYNDLLTDYDLLESGYYELKDRIFEMNPLSSPDLYTTDYDRAHSSKN